MAKNSYYRKIKTSFWQDSKVSEQMSIQEKYLFLYFLTNPHTNLSGFYEITKKQISDETGLKKEELKKVMDRLISLNLIQYDEEYSELLITNWSRYNWSTSQKLLKGVGNELLYVKSTKLFNSFKEYLKDTDFSIDVDDIGSICISYRYDIPRKEKEETEEELEREKSIRAKAKTSNGLPFFSEFKLNNSELSTISKITGVDLNEVVAKYDALKLNNFTLPSGEVIQNQADFTNFINETYSTGKHYEEKGVFY